MLSLGPWQFVFGLLYALFQGISGLAGAISQVRKLSEGKGSRLWLGIFVLALLLSLFIGYLYAVGTVALSIPEGRSLAVVSPVRSADVAVHLDAVVIVKSHQRMAWMLTFTNRGAYVCHGDKIRTATLADSVGHRYHPEKLAQEPGFRSWTLPPGASIQQSVIFETLPQGGVTYTLDLTLELGGCVPTPQPFADTVARYQSVAVTFPNWVVYLVDAVP